MQRPIASRSLPCPDCPRRRREPRASTLRPPAIAVTSTGAPAAAVGSTAIDTSMLQA
ncbi:MAG: hypothetical protein IPG96_00015 [Proteobacteria bacterium]|nr:hypothetical protein [Pseudomonadota bacterium]